MFIGHTRFSLFVPDSRAWRASQDSLKNSDKYKDYLYNPERLELRTQIFLKHTVPTLADAAQRVSGRHEIVHVVSYSESLPQKYKDKLAAAAAEFPILVLDEVQDGDAAGGFAQKYVSDKLAPGEVFGRYRLDDDDILSTEYFSLMEKYLKDEFVGMVVSLPLGIEAVYDDGRFLNPRVAHVPMNSMGLLSVCRLTSGGTIQGPHGGPHDKSDRYDPVILDSRGMGYLRCVHLGQDNAMRYSEAVILDNLLEHLGKFPPANELTKLTRLFPTVVGAADHTSTVDAPLGEGLAYEFCPPYPQGIGLRVAGRGLPGGKRQNVAVTYLFTTTAGKKLPLYRQVPGIANSPNKKIGMFQYLPTPAGDFHSIAGIYLPDDVRIKAVRIMPLSDASRETVISEIEFVGAQAKAADVLEYAAELERYQNALLTQAVSFVTRNRYRAVKTLSSILGQQRALSIQRAGQSLIRRARRTAGSH